MSCSSQRIQERGIALLVAIFTLVLLSVIGLGLMYATNMETNINANYRDKQLSMYGAVSGLQEARDRLQPAAPGMPLPTEMPTLTNGQVFYIINPSGGETIAPWDSTNRYRDTELCQQGILGLTPTPGVPCTTFPTGSAWYTVIDNSDVSSAPWNLVTPTEMKWTRVTLKGNNMTPVAASGNAGVATQTCWEGQYQKLRPAGYGGNCGPDGSIVSVTVTSGGLGYTSAPTVTFAAPPTGGTQATGTAVVSGTVTGQLSAINVTDPGAGYSVAPVVSFVGVGTGATATAHIVPPGSPVTSVSLVGAGGQCYTTAPPVSFSGGGSGAAATATLDTTASCVAAWSVNGTCPSEAGNTITGVGLSGAAGSGFSGSITFSAAIGVRGRGGLPGGTVVSQTIQDPGSGYTSNPTTLTNVGSCSLTVTAIAGYRVSSLSLVSGGSGYLTTPIVTLGSGSGSAVAPPTATATIGASVTGGTVSGITLNTPGSGYTTPPTVVLTPLGSVTTTATATASLALVYTVSGITLDNPGLGYTVNPTVTLTGGGGSGATATASRANGSDYGRVFLVTSMSQTRSGARSMAQAELSSPVVGAWFPGALTLDGPSPVLENMPNSNQYWIDGNDQDSCSEGTAEPHPAIGGYDDPNASPATTSVDDIIDALPTGQLDHYIGSTASPSVENVYGSLGETMSTPTGLKSLIDQVAGADGAYVYGSNPPSIALGSAASPVKVYVDGDLTLNGNPDAYGVLVVTGKLTMTGNFSWHGIVLVVGDGELDFGGGGTGTIYGTVLVAKIWDDYTTQNLLSSLGSPTMDWNGGGGNGIYYDHCLVENMIPIVGFKPPPSTKPLKVLSTRTVTY